MIAKFLFGLVMVIAAVVPLVWLFGPREPVVTDVRFDETALDGGVDAYFRRVEAAFDDITPGTEKHVVWAGEPENRTPVSVLYVHGFSASLQEVRPLPDQVATALGANLVFTRLAGHGRGSAAMGQTSVEAWMHDMAEALAVARRLGERVLVIGTSTGATLTTLALHEEMGRDVAGVVLVAPNFRVNSPVAGLLTWPAARWWLPLIAGRERSFEPRNEANATFWTTRYPSTAVFPMAASVKAAVAAPHGQTQVPALFVFDDDDRVVDHRVTRSIAVQWGGQADLHVVRVGPQDDVYRHVIAGDILSPGMTDPLTEAILAWAAKRL